MSGTFQDDMSHMSGNPLSAAVVTHACANDENARCWGYVDPITNGESIPCQDISHENGAGNLRNYSAALDAARKIADTMTGNPATSKGPMMGRQPDPEHPAG